MRTVVQISHDSVVDGTPGEQADLQEQVDDLGPSDEDHRIDIDALANRADKSDDRADAMDARADQIEARAQIDRRHDHRLAGQETAQP